jgi:signal peptidase I
MLYPYAIYLILEYTYAKTNKRTAYKDKNKTLIGTTISMVILTFIICLISCQFKYGLLVIGTGSMTGTIDRGDIILYEEYVSGDLPVETILVYEKNGNTIIHRLVNVLSVDGTTRYYTKGDANLAQDEGYITQKQIKGTVKFRIKYLGYLTLWVRDLFE